LSRNSNQIARGRIRRFESYMPSHAVVSNRRSAKEKLRPEGSARRAILGPTHVQGGPRPPVPPLLGGRSFTIGPFYAKPELLIGFAAAVACTIALRFMLQATYLTFCRPSLWRALGGQPRQVLSVGLAGILFWG
jgi:hypothetical protein